MANKKESISDNIPQDPKAQKELLKFVIKEQKSSEKMYKDIQNDLKEFDAKVVEAKGTLYTLVATNNYLKNLREHLEGMGVKPK